ncbi:MAG: gas vesicle protein GvpG [Nitriliruptor sp.]
MIGRLLALPLTAPARAGGWVLEQIVNAAEDELYDEDRIVAQIRDLSAALDAGAITEDEHALGEEALLARLVEARAYRAAREESP